MEYAPRREERGLDREPARAAVGHIEVSIAPRDLGERHLGEIAHLGPDRFVDVAPTHDDRGVPAVIDDPDRVSGYIAASRVATCRQPDASSGQHDGKENRCSAEHWSHPRNCIPVTKG